MRSSPGWRASSERLIRDDRARERDACVVRRRLGRQAFQIGLYLTNQHPVGSDLVEALGGQIRLLHHARELDSVWGAQHFLAAMAMTQPVPFLARLRSGPDALRVTRLPPARA